MFNQVIIAGNLCNDPELRQAGGTSVCKMRLAYSEKRKKKSGETVERQLFISADCWGVVAENTAQFMRKGSKIMAVGKLEQNQYQNKDGVNVTEYRINCENVVFLDKKSVDNHPQDPAHPIYQQMPPPQLQQGQQMPPTPNTWTVNQQAAHNAYTGQHAPQQQSFQGMPPQQQYQHPDQVDMPF